jgi:hypothetical protein
MGVYYERNPEYKDRSDDPYGDSPEKMKWR